MHNGGMYADDWSRWHDDLERRRADPHGSLSITGMYWLTGTPQRFDDVPGSWAEGPDGVTVTLGPGEELTVGGVRLTGEHHFGPVDEEGVEAAFGDALAEIARRGSSYIVRPRHPTNPQLLAYAGTPAYAPAEEWIVPGRFVRFDGTQEVKMGTVVDGLDDIVESPGRVVFTLAGQELALTVFTEAGQFVAFFADPTGGTTTYPAGRRLRIAEPGPDGSVVVDFNRATNPPCAYTEFATCALPPVENRLPVPIEAGERRP